MIITTRAHERATTEAEAAISALDQAIADAAEQLDAARDEAGRLEDAWNILGEEMFHERSLASDPFTPNAAAAKAVQEYHRAGDRRLALTEPRQAAAAQLVDCQKRLAFLNRQRAGWSERLAALEAGTDPEQLDGSGGSVAAPGRSEGEGTVEPPHPDSDVPAAPADLPRLSNAVSPEPAGPPVPARPRSRGWLR